MPVTYVRTQGMQIPVGSTGAGTAPSLPNHGVSVLNSATAETYVLMPPEAGVEKTLISTSSTTVARAVRGSTAQTVTFDNQGKSIITFPAATSIDVCVNLVGLSSVRWAVKGIYPVAATAVSVSLSS